MENQTSSQDEANMKNYIDIQIKAGFQKKEEILTSALEYINGDTKNLQLQALAKKWIEESWTKWVEEQKTWSFVTDCDRLDQTFAELEKNGIVARQNFTCCHSCGSTEIWDEIEEQQKQGVSVKGYTFYHQQDTEDAIDGDGIFLTYGSIQNHPSRVEIASYIIGMLKKHGLSAEWNGDPKKRIFVSVDWKKRRI